jgi:hypothetical protein
MSKELKEYIDKLEAYNVQAEGRVKYALVRFDILIISLSSGGLVLSLGIFEKFPQVDTSFVSYAWMFFSIAILINLLSHYTGWKANKLDIECTKICVEEAKGIKPEGTHKDIDKRKLKYNVYTKWLNGSSFISLGVAVFLLVIFVNTVNLNSMSDKDKNKSGGQGEQRSSNNSGKSTGKSETGRLNESESWSKIDKKGQGAGDRPKRDK